MTDSIESVFGDITAKVKSLVDPAHLAADAAEVASFLHGLASIVGVLAPVASEVGTVIGNEAVVEGADEATRIAAGITNATK